MAKVQKLPTANQNPRGQSSNPEPAYTRNGNRYMECINIVERTNPDGSAGKKVWTKVGYGFENKDGTWNLELQAIPADMRIHMRNPRPRGHFDNQGAGQRAAA